jgi:hypothetical protein
MAQGDRIVAYTLLTAHPEKLGQPVSARAFCPRLVPHRVYEGGTPFPILQEPHMLRTILLAAAVLRGPEPEFFPPAPAAVTISRDTVWFRANESHDHSPVSTCYVVSTRSWCPLSRARFAQPASPRLSARFSQLMRNARRKADGEPSAWHVHQGTLWVAFRGFNSEGESQRGSLAAIDTATGRVTRYHDTSIDWHRVATIAAEGRTLWLATVRDGEYGTYGESGLVRLDLSGPRPRFTAGLQGSDTYSSNEVYVVSAANGIIAVMAKSGVAVRRADGRWDWRYWRLGLEGERIGHSLATTYEYNPDAMLLLAVANMRLTRPGTVVRALRQRGIEFGDPNYFPADSGGRALLSIGALPIVRETIERTIRTPGDSLHATVLAAAGLSGDRSLVPMLQRLAPTEHETALALVRLGDPGGITHFKRAIDAAARGYFGIDYQLREVLTRAASPIMVRHIQERFTGGVQPPGSLTFNSAGEPLGLSYEMAGELLSVLDGMNTAESRTAARTLRQRYPSLPPAHR